jgi:penicillin-binding protein 1A
LTTVSDALAHSVNTVAVSILSRVGKRESCRFLRESLGMGSIDPEKDLGAAALALGQQSTGVTLRELLGGYTALAAEGVYSKPYCYTRVESSTGEVLLEHKRESASVLSPETAEIVTGMLRGAVRYGTGQALTVSRSTEVAGKTGTSTGSCDKWFIGYTPSLLAGVWYGFDTPESVADVTGNHALRIFDRVMGRVIGETGAVGEHFPSSGELVTVRYCRDSGLLLSDACLLDPRGDRSAIGQFRRGTEPKDFCTCHVTLRYCAGGGVAGEDCPEELCHLTSLLRVTRTFPRQIKVLDAPYTYGGLVFEEGRKLTENEPYYAVKYETNTHFGIGMGVVPYNRRCHGHAGDDFWERRRSGVATP